jgi:hypothetical protein
MGLREQLTQVAGADRGSVRLAYVRAGETCNDAAGVVQRQVRTEQQPVTAEPLGDVLDTTVLPRRAQVKTQIR